MLDSEIALRSHCVTISSSLTTLSLSLSLSLSLCQKQWSSLSFSDLFAKVILIETTNTLPLENTVVVSMLIIYVEYFVIYISVN